jgi:type VI secretion system secreted protein VgrG
MLKLKPDSITMAKEPQMKTISDKETVSKSMNRFLFSFVLVALAPFLFPPMASAVSILGSAENFAVLAGTPNITNTGSTTITGDVGIFPAASITGTGPGADQINLTGAYHAADAVAGTAKTDLTTAYTALNNMAATQTLVAAELGGLTLTSGVYAFDGNPAAVLLTAGFGALTLDAEGNNNAFWAFQIPNALTTSVGSSVVMTNLGSNVGSDNGLFWAVGSSAGIFGSTSFEGNILALTSITMNNSATINCGRALAQNGTVTMDTNTISNNCANGSFGYSGGLVYDNEGGSIVPIGPTGGGDSTSVPEPSTMLLLGSGLVGFGLVTWRKRSIKG